MPNLFSFQAYFIMNCIKAWGVFIKKTKFTVFLQFVQLAQSTFIST